MGFNSVKGFFSTKGYSSIKGFASSQGFTGGGFPNPVNAIFNYLPKLRQDLIDNVSGYIPMQYTGGLDGLPVFNADGVVNEGEATQILDNSKFDGAVEVLPFVSYLFIKMLLQLPQRELPFQL